MYYKEMDFRSDGVKHVKVHEYKEYIEVESLVVKEGYRCKGVGTREMKEIIHYACKQGKDLYGYASSELGSDIVELKKWYKKLGFKEGNGLLDSGCKYNIFIKADDINEL